MSDLHTFKATGDMVILPRKQYEALLRKHENADDIRAFDEAVAGLEAGDELLPGAFVERLLNTDCRLREWRNYRGLSQASLAAAADIRQATISAIEKGSMPRVDTARRIAAALSCELEDLFGQGGV